MAITKQYIKNTLLIAFGFVLLKSFNLVLPYFLDKFAYNEFNKVFYHASLISTIGTFGFTYALTQLNFTPFILSILVLLNTFISFLLVYFISGIDVTIINFGYIILISFSSILFSVYNFHLLFNSKTNKYFITILIISAGYFSALAVSIIFGIDLLLLFSIFGLAGLIISFKFFDLGKLRTTSDIKKFYKIGFSTFVINSAAGIFLMADKFFANNIFSIEVANAYTFSWALVAPIFYLGNIAEKNIYAADNKNSIKSSLKNSFGLITLGLASYAIFIYFVTNYFPNLLPASININLFADIFLYMIIGHSLFIFFHFPVNGILFKLNFYDSQKLTSYAYLAIITVFVGLYYFNLFKIGADDYLYLLILVVSALLILSISKFSLLFYLHKPAVLGLFKKI